MHRHKGLGWIVAAVALWVAGVAGAREVTVTLKGGAEVSGEWVGQTDTTLTIRMANGAERRIPRAQVEKIDERFSLKEEYRKKRAALDDKDFNGRFELARWLYKIEDPAQQREALQLAFAELNDLLKLKRDEEAIFLRDAVANKLKRLGAATEQPDEPAPAEPGDKPEGEGAVGPGKVALLTPEQINRMKVIEVDLDSRPPVVIPVKVIEEFLKHYLRDPVDPVMKPFVGREGERRFKALDGHQQLAVMFEVKARDFYDKVQIREEPESLQQFRTLINRNYLIKHCGTCHAEGKARGLYVLTTRQGQEQTAYTNLMLLATTEVNGLPMIIKEDPERSPLLQMGLPQKDAATPHPEVKGFKPYFRGTDDNNFRNMVAWIESLYSDPRDLVPDYGAAASGGKPAEGEPAAEPEAAPPKGDPGAGGK